MQNNSVAPALLAVGLVLSACNQNAATAQDSGSVTPSDAASATTPASAPTDLVQVNDDVITKNLFALFFTERQKTAKSTDASPQQQIAALNELTNYMLLAEDATAQQLDKQAGVEAALKLQRINLLARLAIQNHLNSNLPSDDQLKKTYDERIAGKPTQEYKARHILLKTEDEAKAVIAQLDEGADFSDLARSKSTGPSASSGGELDWFESSQMVAPFSEAVAALQDGAYTKQPVKTQFGWHVILREESREVPPPPFEEAKQSLVAESQRKALQDYIKGLRDKANVEYIGQPADSPDKS